MANPGQRSKTRAAAPAPRKKVTIALTASQAAQLRALWQEHSAALHVMLSGWCGDVQNASDILQELFRRLAETPSLMGRMKNARAFLAVSARRLAVDFARRSTTRSAYQTAAGAEVPTAANPGPTDEDLRAAIRVALEALPADQRSVFNHKILNGRTLEEIARFEGISLNTAASRLRYALDKIRGQLRPYYDDLNRSQFKNMKDDLNQDLSENKRIITPLEPKRVPSVVPGLEGLAALSADSGVSDAPTPELAECYALPLVEVPDSEFVEPQVHIDLVFVEPATGGIDLVPESFEEQAPEVYVDGGNGELPELVVCEMFPPDGEISAEWLRPFELPEDFMVTVCEGECEADVIDGSEEVAADGEGVPFDLKSGFEICVLPVPEEFVAEVDPREYLVRYDAFLADNPDWGALDPDVMEAQVITPSNYFSELEFGTPSKAAAFDSWYETHYLGDGSSDGDVQDGGADDGLFDGSAPFEPKELLPRYDAFLAENPTWIQDNQGGEIQLQVITASGHFSDLEFGTPGEAAAFDLWYTSHYSADGSGTLLLGGNPVDFPTEISLSDGGLQGGDEPSLIGKPVFGEGEIVFRDGSFWMNGEIQPHWRSGGGDPELAFTTMAPGASGSVPSGGIVVAGSDVVSDASTVATAGAAESDAGASNASGLSLDGRTGDFPGDTVISGGEVQINPSLIGQFDPSLWEGTGLEARVAELMQTYDPAQSASEEVEAPLAGLRESGAAMEPTALSNELGGAVVQTSIGQAFGGSSEIGGLPVEIAALEIASVGSATGSGDFVSAVSAAQGVHSPNSEPGTASLGAAVGAQVDLAPHALAAADGDFAAHDGSNVSQDVVADAPVAQKHDSTTVAAGAVAVGGVAHGSGAAAAAARKPLPQI